MSLYDNAQSVKPAPAKAGASQLIAKTQIEPTPEGFKALADKIEAAYPRMVLNEPAMRKGGFAPDGTTPMVPFAVKQPKPKAASVTVYYNGTVVWTGIAAL